MINTKVFDDGSKQLNLKGNAFRCDCHLNNFRQWLQATNVNFYHKEEIR